MQARTWQKNEQQYGNKKLFRKVIIYIIIDKLEHKPDKGPIWEGLIWEGMGFTPGQIIHST